MSTSLIVIEVAVFVVILVAVIAVMTRMNRAARQRIERRRAKWKAEGGVGPCPGDTSPATEYYMNIDPGGPNFQQ